MGDFKSEYKRAVDRLEPDSKLLEGLKADMRAAADAPPKPNFLMRYGWVFGSAAACVVFALVGGIFLLIGKVGMTGNEALGGAADYEKAVNRTENAIYCDYSGEGEDMDGAANDFDAPSAIEEAEYGVPSDNMEETVGGVPSDIEKTASGAPSAIEKADDSYSSLSGIEAEELNELVPLSFEDMEELLTMANDGGLTMSELAQYDYIRVTEYRVVLRYDYGDVPCAVAAELSSERVTSFRLYLGSGDSGVYVDLEKDSAEDLLLP